MANWNYRVVRTDFIFEGNTEPVFTVHRCHYNHFMDLLPAKYGKQEAAPEGATVEELRADLHRMLEALDKPVLTAKRDKLIEAK